MRISVSMITLNESENIARALSSCSFADEIVVVDGGSTDGTKEILKSYSKVILIEHPWEGDFGKQRQISLENCSGDWVVRLDADEAFSQYIEDNIRKFLEDTPEHIGGYITRTCDLIGSEQYYAQGLDRFNPCPRIWRNDPMVRWTGHIHETLTNLKGDLAVWDVYVVHYGFLNKQRYKEKGRYYSTIKDSGYSRPEELIFREYNIQPRPAASMVSPKVPRMEIPGKSTPSLGVVTADARNIALIESFCLLNKKYNIEVFTNTLPDPLHRNRDVIIYVLPDKSVDPLYVKTDPDYMIGLEFGLFDKDVIVLLDSYKVSALQCIEIKKKFQKPILLLCEDLLLNTVLKENLFVLSQLIPFIDLAIVPDHEVSQALINLGLNASSIIVSDFKKLEDLMKKVDEAVNLLIQLNNTNNESKITETLTDIRKLIDKHQYTRALELIDEMLLAHPLDIDLQKMKFHVLVNLQRYDEASELLETIELFIDDKDELRNLKEALKKAVPLTPDKHPKANPTNIKLHIGCGGIYKEGYINIDGYDDTVADLRAMADQLPFKNNYADIIESYHLIEHLSYSELRSTFREWYRVLKPGGRLLIECPDLIENMKIFLQSDYKKRWLWYKGEFPYGRLAAFYGNQFHDGQFHKNGFDKERLFNLLDSMGFTDIQTDSVKNTPETNENLHVEASKPLPSEEGFSLILPTYNAARELRLCLESLKQYSCLKHELIVIIDPDRHTGKINWEIIEILTDMGLAYNWSYFINDRNMGPYASWNRGAALSTKELLCFITDDQVFAPGWDINLKKWYKNDRVLTSVLVEPGKIPVWKDNVEINLGFSPEEFDFKAFLEVANSLSKNDIREGGFFIPLLISRSIFFEFGGFDYDNSFGSTDSKGNSTATPYDLLFIEKLKKAGIKHCQVLNSISYHFQGSSWKKK